MTRPSFWSLHWLHSRGCRLTVSLSVLVSLLGSVSPWTTMAFADAIKVPRLGYPAFTTKRIYFDVSSAAQKDPDMYKTPFQKSRQVMIQKAQERKARLDKDKELDKLKEAAFDQLSEEEKSSIEKQNQERLSTYNTELKVMEEALKTEKEALDEVHKTLKEHENQCDEFEAEIKKYKRKQEKLEEAEEPPTEEIDELDRLIQVQEEEKLKAECKAVEREQSEYDRLEKAYYKNLKAIRKKKSNPPESAFNPDDETLMAQKEELLKKKSDKEKDNSEDEDDASPEKLSLEGDAARLIINPKSEKIESDEQPLFDEQHKSFGWLSKLNPLGLSPWSQKWLEDPEKRLKGDFFLVDLRNNHPIYDEPAHLTIFDPQSKKETKSSEVSDSEIPEETDLTVIPEVISSKSLFIEFSKYPYEGVYDLILRGTGLRSEGPIKISNDIYFEALQLVLNDFQQKHCSQTAGQITSQQNCSTHYAYTQPLVDSDAPPPPTHKVVGGWYIAPEGMHLNPRIPLKSTPDIAFVTQTLLKIYLLNPESYSYAKIEGADYSASRYPDLLDEANWGLQYLLSVQMPDGTFASGVSKRGVQYFLIDPDTKSTALAVTALATAAQAFQKTDLSYGLKLLKQAERGWQTLYNASKNDTAVLPWLYIASQSLSQISQKPEYITSTEQTKFLASQLPELVQFMEPSFTPPVLSLPSTKKQESGFSLKSSASRLWKKKDKTESEQAETEASETTESQPVVVASPQETNLLAETTLPTQVVSYLKQSSPAFIPLHQWVSDQFGYDEIFLVRDNQFKVDSLLSDPLEWATFKTGEAITRYNARLEEQGASDGNPTATRQVIEALEAKEKVVQSRLEKGYQSIQYPLTDRAILAYSLALLNSSLKAPEQQPNQEGEVEEQEVERYLSF